MHKLLQIHRFIGIRLNTCMYIIIINNNNNKNNNNNNNNNNKNKSCR